MDTKPLERFAQAARRQLHEQVAAKLEQVLRTDSAELREQAAAVQQLRQEIKATSKAAVVERVAYTWFNRFCALRFMDVNHYTRMGTVSPAPGFTQPELLQEAKQGIVDPELPVDRQRVLDLLSGRLPSREPQQEAYRLLLAAVCNHYHGVMPFLFEPLADYTELLMPDDLLSAGSILQAVREAMTPAACQDVEVIGWLYQFYIAEKKAEVDAKVKQGGKVEAGELPAKTSLYTPHWIVRFLMENSLGRLWLLNRPASKLAERMDYYIRPTEPETDFLRVRSPEEVRVADSAVGSGHMLAYAFDLLYAIYEEEGYSPPEIPRLILEKNLYGMEIDERAAALAAFALTMKARAKDRRFFRRGVRPNICVLRSVHIDEQELEGTAWLRKLGENLVDLPVRDALLRDLQAAEQLANVGSLLRPQLTLEQIERVRAAIGADEDLFTQGVNDRVREVLAQLEYLAKRYHVVIANPPYLGKGMNEELGDFAKSEYPISKADLFAMFMERNLDLAMHSGMVAMITMQSWMFLSSYEKLRAMILDQNTLLAMAHLGANAFDTIGGEVVSTTASVIKGAHDPEYKGVYIRLVDGNSEAEKEAELRITPGSSLHYASAADFKKIPGAPIAYWVSSQVREVYATARNLKDISHVCVGLQTGENDRFVRMWYEVEHSHIGFGFGSTEKARESALTWFPYNKGGEYRKWYGNQSFVVNWKDDGADIRNFVGPSGRIRSRPQNTDQYFQPALSWSKVTSGRFALRCFPKGFIFDVAGCSIFIQREDHRNLVLGMLNSRIMSATIESLSPTLNYEVGQVQEFPVLSNLDGLPEHSNQIIVSLKDCAASDWNSFETSWGFTDLPLLQLEHRRATLAGTYISLRSHWQARTLEMRQLEEENNRIFINAYGLEDEFTPDVPLHEITLTCNPHYRYGPGKSEAENEALLRADTMREFVSYAVGCMFGRYSLDKPGLILANQGETVEDYMRKVTGGAHTDQIRFMPDRDNVLPILEGEWFEDDIVGRFKRFLRVTFGDAHYTENLAFLEDALGRDIRSYFLRDFYDDHVKRYQKRPIYWLFSSPKGSFNALIYMHRYRPDTVSVVLNDYLREFRTKLSAHKSHLEQVNRSASATAREKTAALKEMDKLDKIIAELNEYEREVLYPLATQQIVIDLDDGVKVNYRKFGKALKRVPGLSEA